jgi:hypothetical protein
MTDKYSLTLPFRGARPYLHGTDIYMAIKEAVAESFSGPISISFHSLLKKQPDLLCSSESLRGWRSDPAFRGEIRMGTGSAAISAVILESDREVKNRKDCNEEAVVVEAKLVEASKGAILSDAGIGLPIEKVVFLNKWLHLKLLPHLSPKWLFARLELAAPLPEVMTGELRVQLEQVLADRFTRSGVFLNDERLGAISFSTPQ